MTDTGQIPGEGLPENAVGDAAHRPHPDVPGNGVPQQPGWGAEPQASPVPQPSPVPPAVTDHGAAAYNYLDQPAAPGAVLEDEDDVLLMPGPQGSWSDPQPVPPQRYDVPSVPGAGLPSAAEAAAPPAAPRRPLHMGPPITDTPSGGVSVRSLADRGPAVRATGPQTSGPEYLDVPSDDAAGIPAQQTGEPANPAAPVPGSAWPAAPTGPIAPVASQQSLIPHADSIIPPQHFPPAPQALPAHEGSPHEGPQFALPGGQGAAEGVAPGGGPLPERVAAVPAQPLPEQVQPEQVRPQQVHPEGVRPGPVLPGVAHPEMALSEAALSDGVLPEGALPEGALPEQVLAEPVRPEPVSVVAAPSLSGVTPDGQSLPGEGVGPVGAAVPPTPGAVAPVPSVVPVVGPAVGPEASPVAVPAAGTEPVVGGAAPVGAGSEQGGEGTAAGAVALPEQASASADPIAVRPAGVGAGTTSFVLPEQLVIGAAGASPVPPPDRVEGEVAGLVEAHAPAEGEVGGEAAAAPHAAAGTQATSGPQVPDGPHSPAGAHAPADPHVPAPGGPLPAPAAAAEPPVSGSPATGPAAPGAGDSTPPPAAAGRPAAFAVPVQAVATGADPDAAVPPAASGPEPSVPAVPFAVEDVAGSGNFVVRAPAADAPGNPAAPEAITPDVPGRQSAEAAAGAGVDAGAGLVAEAGKGRRRRRAAPAEEAAEAAEAAAAMAAAADARVLPPVAEAAASAVAVPLSETAGSTGSAETAGSTGSAETAGTPETGTTPEADAPAPAPAEAYDEAREPYKEEQGPAAEPYEPAVRDAVHRVIRERRDIRNGFRSDPIPHDVLLRVLEAAHTAPSVGHSQPWDFVVIRSGKTREKMHELAMLQREEYAKTLPKGRARQFRELKIEAILDTPVNIVVTSDPTRGGRHTLGRHTQPQMAPYSSALAVENLWLAARAEGLGVGWVSFFDERQMVAELGLPEHLEVVAYLCVGYVDEFPDEPELMQAGWSKRRPLSWVVHDEEYGNRALPGEEPHDLLDETLRGIRPLDAKALGEAWERQKRMTKPAGALGMLEIISAQLSGLSRECPPPIPEPAAVAIFAGDHGVHAQGVTSWPQEVTAQMVANFLGGGAVCNAFANQVGAEVCVIDVGVASELPTTPGLLPRKVRPGTADFTVGPAMSREEALRAIEIGIETARDLVAAGNKALLTGEMGIANTTVSAALIAVFTGADPAEITGRGTGINDEMHARKIEVVRRGLDLHRPDPADPINVLAAIGGLEHAAMVGFLLGAAALRTPVILDGVSAGAAALVARAIAPEVLAACIAGHRSAEPGHVAALTTLGLRPLVDLDLRLGEGTGALLALPLVQSAARVMHEVATFDAAGVTEKG